MRLLEKELRTLIREPMIIMMIVLPFIIYSAMSPFYGSMTEQVKKAAELRGVRLAVLECKVDPFTASLLEAAAARMEKANVTVRVERGCQPLPLLEQGYDAVLVLNGSLTRGLSVSLYVAGSLQRIARTLALPTTLSSRLGDLLSPGGKARMNVTSYIYLSGRIYSFNEISGMFNSAMMLAYASFFIFFPAASVGASLIGAEREERMLDVLLSLPLPRRSIAAAKAVAAITVAALAAASALAGLLVMMRSLSLEIPLTRYYTLVDIGLYAAALLSEAFFIVVLAMIVGLFASTMRGAQAAATIAVIPAIIPPMMALTGVAASKAATVIPYMATLYASLTPVMGREYAALATLAQAVEALAAAAVFIRLLESEVAVTGPETLKRLRHRLQRRR